MQTLLLNPATWDLMLDASGNIAVASDPYSLAQDAASAIKLFQGELWYDTSQGVPYFQQILNQPLNLSLVKVKLAAAALTVPDVETAVVFLTGFSGRTLTGQVQITDATGTTSATSF